jgi:hypothetical protein
MSPINRSEFCQALAATGPHPDIPIEHQIFRPFIGSWDLAVTWYDKDGAIRRQQNGEWHFSWVLEGRAVQDVWIVPPRTERSGSDQLYEYGASLRFFDSETGLWRSTWIGPMQRSTYTFAARMVGADLVLDTKLDGSRMRWTFSDIAPDRFRWTNEKEEAGAWVVTQDFSAVRSKLGR